MDALTSFVNEAQNTLHKVAPSVQTIVSGPSSQFGEIGFTGATRIGTSLFENDTPIHAMINYVILAAALYLAFKCKKDGKINIINMILALCFSPCFLAYAMVKKCKT